MRILVSAIACNPERGSEAHFGWSVVRALSGRHEVHVLGHGNDREAIERAVSEGRLSGNVSFHYLGGWQTRHRDRIVARLQNWQDYRWWNRAVLPMARDLHAQSPFDLVHHVTLSTWRVGTPLWRLGIPLVWGPVGGAERFPIRLLGTLSSSAAAYELFRSLQGGFSYVDPEVRRCARASACAVASNPGAAQLLSRLAGRRTRIPVLCAAFFASDEIARLQRPVDGAESPRLAGPLQCFAGGDVEGRKGLALALRALAILKNQGIPFRYHVGGTGPETGHLRRLAERLGIADWVILGEPLQGEAYRRKLQATDVYLLPSLRDNAPVTLMEAMLAGCVPVVVDCGGPAGVVGEGCGFRVPVGSAGCMVRGLAEALGRLNADRDLRRRMSVKAAGHVASVYHEECYLQKLELIYQEAFMTHGQDRACPVGSKA